MAIRFRVSRKGLKVASVLCVVALVVVGFNALLQRDPAAGASPPPPDADVAENAHAFRLSYVMIRDPP